MRLDKYLTNKYSALSRAYIKNQIKLGNFLVNGKQAKSFYDLRESDLVAFAPGFSLPGTTQILPNPDIKLNVIYEDQNVIVINKPAGLSVHPRQDKNGLPLLAEIDATLVSGLLAYYPAIATVGDQTPKGAGDPESKLPDVLIRPGLVHRLDKDTSGAMIIAKNQNSFDWLKKQFQDRLVSKKYIALVHGRLKEKNGVIQTRLSRSVKNPTKQKIAKDSGKEAVTEYRVIKEFKDYSLVEACPKTGRLHQIRVHLAYIGHPVAGDKKYGNHSLPEPAGLKRQFLHAAELKIALPGPPDGQEKLFTAPLPAELASLLEKMR